MCPQQCVLVCQGLKSREVDVSNGETNRKELLEKTFRKSSSWAGLTYLRYTMLTSPKKVDTAVYCCDPSLSVLVMLVSRNVFHVISDLQSIGCNNPGLCNKRCHAIEECPAMTNSCDQPPTQEEPP